MRRPARVLPSVGPASPGIEDPRSVLVIWVAARICSAGILLFGQKPGLRAMRKALRQAT